MNEKIVLSHNLFDGDFGEQDTRTLKNKIVITRKTYKKLCHICMSDIKKGEQSRIQTDIFEGKIEDYRVCFICCNAISYDYENYDLEQEIDKRYKIGYDIRHKASYPNE